MTSITWKPQRSVEECEKILTAPGRMHELELAIIDGRVLRVYKHLPPNLRTFWLAAVQQFKDRDYLVFEKERYTFGQVHERAAKLASLFYTKYNVRKGDRVVIIMRNFPEFLIAFWAIHLLGGVSALINAWAPAEPLLHCVKQTNPKVLIVDPERADRLAGRLLEEVKQHTSVNKVLVARAFEGASASSSHSSKWRWKGMSSLDEALASYQGPVEPWRDAPVAAPEDDSTIFFTSGTTGLPKGVLSTQRSFLTNFFNAFVSKFRAILRRGEEIPVPNPDEPQKATLLSVPLFHVTGCTSSMITCTGLGAKIVLIRKWEKEEAARLIMKERITAAGGVPSMIMDLLESSLDKGGSNLESLACGGAPAANNMPIDVHKKFNIEAGQGYGLSETNAITATIAAEDYLARPTSTGLASPINDLLIVDPATNKILPPNNVGELWIKGCNVMRGYWADPVATDKAITRDGWFKSGDIASIDEEGFLYIKDRVKDVIIRGGENVHCVEVENALYTDERIMDAAAVSVPDKRLGELVAAVVSTKPHFRGQVSEEEIIEIAKKSLSPHAVPVMVLVQDELIERNANGKIMKDSVRKRVRKEWAERLKSKATGQPKEVRARL